MTYSGGAPNPEILGPRKSTHPSQTRGGGRSGVDKGYGTLRLCKGGGGVGSGGRGVPQPPPTASGQPQVPSNSAPLRGPRGRLWKSPRVPSPREVLGCYPSTPTAAPPPPARGQKGEGSANGWGAKSGSLRRRHSTDAGGIPEECRRAAGRGWGSDGRPGLRGPDSSGQVQRPSCVRAHRLGLAKLDPPWDTRPAPPVAPTPPGTRASGPLTPASVPGVARRALLTPHYPEHHRRAPPRPRAPCLPPRPPRPHREPGPHLCQPPPLARSLRLCRRRSEPHTHRYTQPSDVTEPSARPRHCGDTRLPADAAAVSGRPGEREGGGEGEGWGTEPAAAPRARSRRRRRRHRLSAPSSSGTRAPSGLLWLLRAPPRPVASRARPSPPGALPALLASRAVWAAGAPRCLRCTRRRQDVPSPPHPHRHPPSFLPRVAQPAVWGRHRPAPAPPAALW